MTHRRYLTGKPPLYPSPGQLLNGTAQQLWFLPFALLACLALFPLGRLLARRSGAAAAAAWAAGLLALAAVGVPRPDPGLWGQAGAFFERSWSALPAVGLGVAVHAAARGWAGRPAWRRAAFAAGTGLFLASLAWTCWRGYHQAAGSAGGAALLLAALAGPALAGPALAGARLAGAGRLGFGVFVGHPVFTAPALAAAALGYAASVPAAVLCFAAAAAASLALAALLLRHPRTRWLVA